MVWCRVCGEKREGNGGKMYGKQISKQYAHLIGRGDDEFCFGFTSMFTFDGHRVDGRWKYGYGDDLVRYRILI